MLFKKKYYGTSLFGPAMAHSANKEHAERGTANSTTSEKGTDGKQNNSSEYNHKYYEENKEKWEDNKSSESKGGKVTKHHYDPEGDDEDFKKVYGDDLKNPKLNTDTHIKGTDFYQVTNKKGQVVLINGDKKWTLPEGVKLTDGMKQMLAKIDSKGGKQGEAFDKAMAEFMKKNKYEEEDIKLEKKKSSKKSSKSSEEKSESTSSKKDSSEKKTWDDYEKDYDKDKAKKKEEEKKAADAAVKAAQDKGKKETEALKKKKQQQKSTKSSSQFKHSDNLGSVLIKDLF